MCTSSSSTHLLCRGYPQRIKMLTQVFRTVLRASSKVLTLSMPLYRATCTATYACKLRDMEGPRCVFGGVRHLCSMDKSDQSDNDTGNEPSSDETSDNIYSDREIFEAFQSQLNLDDDNEEKEASQREMHSEHLEEEPLKDEQKKKPWNRKERVKACLDKLKRGPDGRYINVFEVATEVDMLIASYLKLRKQENPSLAENSDDDEKLMEGIDMEKFKRLQKRLRDGTYEFQPVVHVPLPKRKIVKKKKKKMKKHHDF